VNVPRFLHFGGLDSNCSSSVQLTSALMFTPERIVVALDPTSGMFAGSDGAGFRLFPFM
jgi:hypothetical protein